jgi:hypothetical protein
MPLNSARPDRRLENEILGSKNWFQRFGGADEGGL